MLLAVGLGFTVLALGPVQQAPVLAQRSDSGLERPRASRFTGSRQRDVERAIDRGVRFPARSKSPVAPSRKQYPVADYLACRHGPRGSGVDYGGGPLHELHRAVLYLIDRASPSGYIRRRQDLTDALGTPTRSCSSLKSSARRNASRGRRPPPNRPNGVKLIERSQSVEGGWIYEPDGRRGDESSITVC